MLDERTFVLWEPCSKSHAEIVPGYASLLSELGYRVVILMTPERLQEGLFERVNDPNLVFAELNQGAIRRAMKSPWVHRAAGLLVTTAGKLPEQPDGKLDLQSVFGGRPPEKLLLVEHDAGPRCAAGNWDERSITLRPLPPTLAASHVVNPHGFGKVLRKRTKSRPVIFTMVGAARAGRGNRGVVLNAVEHLLADGIGDFQFRMIGKPDGKPVPKRLSHHIVELGRVPFGQLYSEMEKADFLVTAFQGDSDLHMPYRTTKTSGSFQLAYGFAKPLVLQKSFTDHTGLSRANCVLYDRDDAMFDALVECVRMPESEYAALCKNMERCAATLHTLSLENLGNLIND